MSTSDFILGAIMRQARTWASVALFGLVAASLSVGAVDAALAAGAGTEVLQWNVHGSVEAGGIYSFGERGSSKFNEYRDMDNGFVGSLELKGEKKESPYFFDLWLKNPARDDQAYEGAMGRLGLFELELGWDRNRHVISNSASTIFQQNGNDFTIPATLRNTITTTPAGYLNSTAANCVGITSWTCPNPVGSAALITTGNAQYNFIQGTINGLARPVDLGFNTDVGLVGLKVTPTDSLRFDLEYQNRRQEGRRAQSVVIGSPGGSPIELAIPLDNVTHEMKFGAEFARPDYAFQFNYTGSFFQNDYQSYLWDNPLSTVSQSAVAGVRTAASARGEVAAAPDNTAHTFSLTGRGGLPWWRTNLNGSFSYTMLRQDETFLNNVPVTGLGLTQTNADSLGRTSADAQANLVQGNLVLTTRPLKSVTATARYRYFELQNDTPVHTFNFLSPTGQGTATAGTTHQERFTKQNAGGDIVWRPIRSLSLKGGYEYEHWHRGDFDGKNFGTDEHTAKAAVDVTPVDWFLGRVTYNYGIRSLDGAYGADPQNTAAFGGTGTSQVPGFYKFNYADRTRNRVDVLMQFSPWETVTPSLNFGYSNDDFSHSAYGMTKDENLSAGASLSWSPIAWLTLSTDYTYEQHNYKLRNQSGGLMINDWEGKGKDEYHTVGVNAVVDIIPKKFDVNLGYGVTFGYTTLKASNIGAGFVPTAIVAATTGVPNAYNWDRIYNVLQTVKVVGRFRMTEKLSFRGGFAYERYNERDFATDPMKPFMGDYEQVTVGSGFPITAGVQSAYLGATTGNYEAYTLGAVIRYDF